ncbi:MAG: Major facilitator superfamily 1, partial [Verrucomicrobiales bacterium]|nr:Major facilitator superfamily 1 [Verrucomicrobiales bacterium]
FFCAIAPTYPLLVAARIFAGAFGGVAGSLILAIIGDVVPEQRRGAAMGMVMSSFSVASICGVPLGLWLASHFSWHIPFYVLTGFSLTVLVASGVYIPHLREHLKHGQDLHPIKQVWAVMSEPSHAKAFLFMASLTGAGFSIFPYIATYMVSNVGLTERQLPLIYLVGGLCTLVTMNLIGRWADRAGKPKVFRVMSLTAIVPIVALTNLPHVPVILAIMTSTAFMICMSGRMVPAMALMTATVEARYRGGFMSINSSVQQFSSGLFAYVSGNMIGQSEGGGMTHFGWVGVVSISCVLLCIFLARFLKQPEGVKTEEEPVFEAA